MRHLQINDNVFPIKVIYIYLMYSSVIKCITDSHSSAHTSKFDTTKSASVDRISFSNVDVLELLPLYKLSLINNPNLPRAPPPNPID